MHTCRYFDRNYLWMSTEAAQHQLSFGHREINLVKYPMKCLGFHSEIFYHWKTLKENEGIFKITLRVHLFKKGSKPHRKPSNKLHNYCSNCHCRLWNIPVIWRYFTDLLQFSTSSVWVSQSRAKTFLNGNGNDRNDGDPVSRRSCSFGVINLSCTMHALLWCYI